MLNLNFFPYQDLEEHSEDLRLLDPSSPNTTVGSISISCHIEVTVLDHLPFLSELIEHRPCPDFIFVHLFCCRTLLKQNKALPAVS
jgi:hypothetical protein